MPNQFHLPPEFRAPHHSTPVMREENKTIAPILAEMQALNLLCSTLSVGMLLGTIMFARQLPSWAKTISLATATGTSAALLGSQALAGTNALYNLKEKIDKARALQLKDHLATQLARSRVISEFENNQFLIDQIMRLPVEQQLHYLKKFNLLNLVPWHVEAVKELAPPPPAYLREDRQSTIHEAGRIDDSALDFSWLDSKFNKASKGVFGEKGSGKSYYLAYEAYQFLKENPKGEVRIIDSHYSPQDGIDPADFDPEGSLWFLGVPEGVIKDRFVVSLQGDSKGKHKGREGFVKRTMAMYRRAYNLMEYRKQHGLRGKKADFPFKLINDEFVSTLVTVNSINKKWTEELIEIVQQVQFEGRKYNIDMTLGLHVLKKEIIKIDSSVLLGNMDLLFLGSALGDPNTPLPTDMSAERNETIACMNTIREFLEPGQGYPCAIRRKGERITIQVIPHLTKEMIWYDYEPAQSTIEDASVQFGDTPVRPGANNLDGDNSTPTTPPKPGIKIDYKAVYIQLRTWWRDTKPTPTDEQIFEQFKAVTGEDVLPNAKAALLAVVKGDQEIN